MMNGLPACLRPYDTDFSWDELYPYLPLQRLHLGILVTSYIMALHGPHATSNPHSREAGVKAALDTLDFQQRQFEMLKPHQYRIYGFSFYTINAGLFLSAIAIDNSPEVLAASENIRSALQQGVTRLTIMQEKSAMAKSGVAILRQCVAIITASGNSMHTPRIPPHGSVVGLDQTQTALSDYSKTLESPIGPQLLSHGLDFNATMLESMGLIPDLMFDPFLGSTDWPGFVG